MPSGGETVRSQTRRSCHFDVAVSRFPVLLVKERRVI